MHFRLKYVGTTLASIALKGLALLPFGVLYGLAFGLYCVIYWLIRYRVRVVRQNVQNAFPLKSEKERRTIERQFYRHLCRLLVETPKLNALSRAEIQKRCRFADLSIFQHFAATNQNFIVLMGHTGNWEWAGAAAAVFAPPPLSVYALYKPLHNSFFDSYMLRLRQRFGTRLIPMRDTLRIMAQNRQHLHYTVFLADQTPAPEHALWLPFLNQETPFFMGAEKIARSFNYPVVYAGVRYNGVGRYTIHLSLVTNTPNDLPHGAITQKFAELLENDIKDQPFNWLWSHRRWKHRRQ